MEIRAVMRQRQDGTWEATVGGDSPLSVSGPTREACLGALRQGVDRNQIPREQRVAVVVEVLPRLAGLAEAAQVMGWDKRRVATYIRRGSFPEPLQGLASGRVWLREDIEEFSERWHARHRARSQGSEG
jgi:hypothetical protein